MICRLGQSLAIALAMSQVGGLEAQGSDPGLTFVSRYSWHAVIRSDTARGVELSVSALLRTGATRDGEPRQFFARYRPDELTAWLEEAASLLRPDRIPAGTGSSQLTTSALSDVQGGRFLAARTRSGNRWSRQVILSFRPSGKPSLTFQVPHAEAAELFTALAPAARQARLTDLEGARTLDPCGLDAHYSEDSTVITVERVSGPAPIYPVGLKEGGVEGVALMAVTIDTLGAVVNVRTAYSSHRDLATVARDAIMKSKWKPAMKTGRPFQIEVCQPVTFSLNR